MTLLNTDIHSVTAFAPATCANVAIGFDILGFALENIGDRVTLTLRDDDNIIIEAIHGNAHLPFAAEKNTAGIVLQKLRADLQIKNGFTLQIHKGIPVSSGLGGSAASAVAALTAFNAFLKTPLTKHELAHYALYGEELASGQAHADNIVPAIFGGFTLIRALNPIEMIALPIPNVHCALLHPQLQVETKAARQILKDAIKLQDHIEQSTHLASFIVALYENNLALLKHSLQDKLIEHQRAHFVKGFYEVKAAALSNGALGMSFSGSGPSVFAFAESADDAHAINQAMQASLMKQNIASTVWVSGISAQGAHVIEIIKRSI